MLNNNSTAHKRKNSRNLTITGLGGSATGDAAPYHEKSIALVDED
jgi:hypothetical protein